MLLWERPLQVFTAAIPISTIAVPKPHSDAEIATLALGSNYILKFGEMAEWSKALPC